MKTADFDFALPPELVAQDRLDAVIRVADDLRRDDDADRRRVGAVRVVADEGKLHLAADHQRHVDAADLPAHVAVQAVNPSHQPYSTPAWNTPMAPETMTSSAAMRYIVKL